MEHFHKESRSNKQLKTFLRIIKINFISKQVIKSKKLIIIIYLKIKKI